VVITLGWISVPVQLPLPISAVAGHAHVLQVCPLTIQLGSAVFVGSTEGSVGSQLELSLGRL
jgi:hypothetical protein